MPSAKYVLFGVAAHVGEGQHGDGRLGRQRRRRAVLPPCRSARHRMPHAIDADGLVDVLDGLRARDRRSGTSSLPLDLSCTLPETQMPPGSARASSRAATLTPSP